MNHGPRHILVVEDEEALAEGLRFNLERKHYAVDVARDGVDGLERARASRYDLIILDIRLPGVDGFKVCQRLRAEGNFTPILVLTARNQPDDVVYGLKLGADDYVTKPFSVRELMARIKAVLRRTQNDRAEKEPSTILRGPGNLIMDVERRAVTVADTVIELTRLEFDLLHRLLINPGRVLTRERLLEQAWGYDYVGDTRAVDSAVKRLRAKLREASPEADCIESVRGLGYRINTVPPRPGPAGTGKVS